MKSKRLTLAILFVLTVVFLIAAGIASAEDFATAVPLPELGTDTYQGQMGGLYPNGLNVPPPTYLAQLDAYATQLQQEQQAGDPPVCVFVGISAQQNINSALNGMSPNPNFVFIDGALGSKQQQWQDINFWGWSKGLNQVDPNEVDCVYFLSYWGGLSGEFVASSTMVKESFRQSADNIAILYPNAELILFSSIYYVGYTPPTSKAQEPWGFQSGYSVKWLIEDRINCTVDCGPLIAWGAYTWDETWPNSWYCADDLHLCGNGRTEAALIVRDQLLSWSYTAPFYGNGTPQPTATPTGTAVPTETPGPGVTPTPSPFPSVTATGDPTVTPELCGRMGLPCPPTRTPTGGGG